MLTNALYCRDMLDWITIACLESCSRKITKVEKKHCSGCEGSVRNIRQEYAEEKAELHFTYRERLSEGFQQYKVPGNKVIVENPQGIMETTSL